MMRVPCAQLVAFLACSVALAQQPPCSVPVNVVAPDLSSLSKPDADLLAARWKEHTKHGKGLAPRPDSDWLGQALGYTSWLGGSVSANWTLIRDLPADAFVAQNKKHPLRIQSATTDRSPRRIIFVVENGKGVTEAARNTEWAKISHIASKARPEDSFALLTAAGPRLEVRFGSSRDALRAAAEGLRNPPQGKPHGQAVLDAVLQATTWFQPPQPGDSIFLMTMNLEGRHKASFSTVQATLAAGHIRVFGFQLGGYSIFLPTYPGSAEGHVSYLDKAFALTGSSGGMALLETPWEPYELTGDRLEEPQREAKMLYEAITEYYLLQLDSIGRDLVIDLAPTVRSQLPLARVLYPRHLPPCSNPAGTLPAAAGIPK